jgi:hypothetical protein
LRDKKRRQTDRRFANPRRRDTRPAETHQRGARETGPVREFSRGAESFKAASASENVKIESKGTPSHSGGNDFDHLDLK